MRVWCDVYDSAGNRMGNGPVTAIKSASFKRALDGAGTFSVVAVGTDAQALSLLQNDRQIKIYGSTLAGAIRLLGSGVIRDRVFKENSGAVDLSVSGPDALDELKRVNTLLARTYNDTVENVATDLIALVSGWSIAVDATIADNEIIVRYDGVSVLKALQELADRYGYHLRLSNDTDKLVELAPFGQDNGLRVSKVEIVTIETIANNELLLVQSIEQSQTTENLCNWVVPLGAGEGVGALTLEHSTRTSPYTIQTATGPDGRPVYYLSDVSSIASYGMSQAIGQFKSIAPITNSSSDVEAAANALYDAAVELLSQRKAPIEQYALTVKNAQTTILPGDKIEVDYQAQIETPTGLVDYLSVRDKFWVLSVTESVSDRGTEVDLTISNIPTRADTPAESVMQAIEQINLKNLQPVTTSSVRSYVYDREIDSTSGAIVPVEFTNATLYAQRVRLRLKTSPFTSTAQAAAAGGDHDHTVTIPSHSHTIALPDHQHQMFEYAGAYPPGNYSTKLWFARSNESTTLGARYDLYLDAASDLSGNPLTSEIWTYASGGGSTVTSALNTQTVQTSNASGTHTHPIVYGIANDTQHPQGITVSVNGIDKTSELFGSPSLAGSNAPIDVVSDAEVLTGLLVNASGGLQQEHSIGIECSSGQGRVEVTVEIYEITQTIAVI